MSLTLLDRCGAPLPRIPPRVRVRFRVRVTVAVRVRVRVTVTVRPHRLGYLGSEVRVFTDAVSEIEIEAFVSITIDLAGELNLNNTLENSPSVTFPSPSASASR